MELHFPDLAYDCLTCGKGCRAGWRIPVEENVREGLVASAAAQKARGQGYQPIEELGGRVVLGHRPDRNCVFLRADQLCELHAELGLEAKPLQCQQFPFLPVNTPDGVFVGLSFYCTAVQQGHGRPAREHALQVESLVERLNAKLQARPAEEMAGRSVSIALTRDRAVDWAGYLAYEARVRQALEGDPYRGLWSEAQALIPPKPDAGDLILLFVATMAGLAEAGSPGQRQSIAQAIMGGVPFHSDRLGLTLQPVPLDSPHLNHDQGCHAMPAWLLPEIRRYLQHLVFRKFLFQGSSMLAQTLTLLTLVPLLDYYTRLSALNHGREPGLEDFHRALDVAEAELITHADGAGNLYAFFEGAMHPSSL